MFDLTETTQVLQRTRGDARVRLAAEPAARGRMARSVKLNRSETIALITELVVEGARDGRSVSDLMEAGVQGATADQCMPGVAEMNHDVQVEATFPEGNKLVTVHHPNRMGGMD